MQRTEFKSVDTKLSVSLQRCQSNYMRRNLPKPWISSQSIARRILLKSARHVYYLWLLCTKRPPWYFPATGSPQFICNSHGIRRYTNNTSKSDFRNFTSASFNFIHLSLSIFRRNGTKKVSLSGVNFHGKSEYSTLAHTTQEYCFWRALIGCFWGDSPDRYHFPYSSRIQAKGKVVWRHRKEMTTARLTAITSL